MVTGRMLGGLQMYDEHNLLTREEALKAWIVGGAWFSSDEASKGTLARGALADLSVLTDDFMTCGEVKIKDPHFAGPRHIDSGLNSFMYGRISHSDIEASGNRLTRSPPSYPNLAATLGPVPPTAGYMVLAGL